MNRPLRSRFSGRGFIALLGLLLFQAGAAAQEGKVRTSVATKGEIWVGQRVVVAVELLAPGFFSGAPAFDLPNPPGMLLIPPEESPTVSSEEIGGAAYTVQRYELSVFPQHAGSQILPPLAVRFRFKRGPLDPNTIADTVRTEPVRFTAKLPPGAEALGNLISARDLDASETWKPDPATEKPRVGDAFTRTVAFSAPEVPAMLFPPFPTGKIDGLGIYPKPPRLLDQNDRGERRGERRDTIVYVCEQPGRFTIPSARLTWWDLDAGRLRTFEFPARTLEVAPNPAMAEAASTRTAASPAIRKTGLAIALAVAALGAAWLTPKRFWQRAVAPLRPVHLAPLNPPERR